MRFKGDLLWRKQKVHIHLYNDGEVILTTNQVSCKEGGKEEKKKIFRNVQMGRLGHAQEFKKC